MKSQRAGGRAVSQAGAGPGGSASERTGGRSFEAIKSTTVVGYRCSFVRSFLRPKPHSDHMRLEKPVDKREYSVPLAEEVSTARKFASKLSRDLRAFEKERTSTASVRFRKFNQLNHYTSDEEFTCCVEAGS